jgi:hypothetical protein
MAASAPIKGIIHGKTIELEEESGLPDGSQVAVVLQSEPARPNGEGLRRAFGGWAGEDVELDAFLAEIRSNRKQGRAELSE